MLSAIAHEWMHIGVLLGVPYQWLCERVGTSQQNLIESLRYWLEHTPEATLQHLVEAVEHQAGGNNQDMAARLKSALEERIHGKHIVIQA